MDDVQETGATSMRKSKRSKRTPAHLKNSVVPVAKKGCRNGNKRPTSQKDSRCHSESRRSDDSDSVVSNPMEESQEKSLGGAHCELNPPVVQNDHVTLAVLRSKPCSITSPANSTGEDSGTSASIEAGKGVASSAPSDSQTRTTGEVDIAIPALDVDIDSDTEVGGTETSSTISAVSPSTISKVSTAHEFVEACTKLCQIYNTHASTDKSLLKVARSIWNKPIRVEKGRIISMKTVLMKEMFSPDMHREAISNLRRVQVSLAKAVHIAVGKPLDESMTLITKVWEAMSVLHVSTGQGKSRRMARTFLFTYKLKSHNADIRRKVIEVAANIFRLPNNDSNHLTDSKNMLFVLLGKNCDDATNLEEIRNDCLDLMEVTKADNIFEYSNKIGIRQILLRQGWFSRLPKMFQRNDRCVTLGSRSSETFVNNKEVVGSYFRFMLEVVRHLGLRNNNHVITEWSVADFDKEIPWRVEVMVLATLIVRVLYSTGDNNTSDLGKCSADLLHHILMTRMYCIRIS